MSRVFWDTNLFIYLVEDKQQRGRRVAELRSRLIERGDQLFTSAITLGEALVKPLESGNLQLRAQYEELITRGCVVLPFETTTSLRYASIRQDRVIKPADAIQLACASQAGIDLFITNDDRLSNRTVAGIQFITSLERAFL